MARLDPVAVQLLPTGLTGLSGSWRRGG